MHFGIALNSGRCYLRRAKRFHIPHSFDCAASHSRRQTKYYAYVMWANKKLSASSIRLSFRPSACLSVCPCALWGLLSWLTCLGPIKSGPKAKVFWPKGSKNFSANKRAEKCTQSQEKKKKKKKKLNAGGRTICMRIFDIRKSTLIYFVKLSFIVVVFLVDCCWSETPQGGKRP